MGTKESEMRRASKFEWVYTAKGDADKETPCSTVDVVVDEWDEYWVGITQYRDGRDFEFHPRAQYGTGEAGRLLAETVADRLAREIAVDAHWVH